MAKYRQKKPDTTLDDGYDLDDFSRAYRPKKKRDFGLDDGYDVEDFGGEYTPRRETRTSAEDWYDDFEVVNVEDQPKKEMAVEPEDWYDDHDEGYVEDQYVEDQYVEDNYVEDRYVDDSYVKGNYVEDHFVENQLRQETGPEPEDWYDDFDKISDEDAPQTEEAPVPDARYDDLEDIYGADKPKKKRPWLRAIVIILVVLAVLALAGFVLLRVMTGGMKHGAIDKAALLVSEVPAGPEIKNIAFIGITAQEAAEGEVPAETVNSVIVASIDSLTDEIKLTSIHLDTAVDLENKKTILRRTFENGGPQLLLSNLNTNFHLDISDYVKFNFAGAAALVDSLGGLDMELSQSEAAFLTEKFPERPVSQGPATLDGAQAAMLAQANPSGTDFFRISTPQELFVRILEKMRGSSIFQKPGQIRQLLACMETSLSNNDVISLAMKVNLDRAVIIENRIPDLEYETTAVQELNSIGQPVCRYDMEEAVERLNHIIYGAVPMEAQTE